MLYLRNISIIPLHIQVSVKPPFSITWGTPSGSDRDTCDTCDTCDTSLASFSRRDAARGNRRIEKANLMTDGHTLRNRAAGLAAWTNGGGEGCEDAWFWCSIVCLTKFWNLRQKQHCKLLPSQSFGRRKWVCLKIGHPHQDYNELNPRKSPNFGQT